MKIAIVGSKGVPAKYGGVQTVVENLAEGFSAKGHTVTVYSRFHYSEIKKRRFTYKGFKVINIKGINTKRLDTLSHSFLSAIHTIFCDYDIVTFHSFIPAFFAFIPKLFGKKVIFHSHGIETKIKKIKIIDKWFIFLFRSLTRFALDGITTVSTSQLIQTKVLYKNKNVELIPNGLVLAEKSPRNEEKYILCVGRIVESKGIEYLIEAFNSLSLNFPEFKLKIVGEPVNALSYYNKLRLKANNNIQIEFLGSKYGKELIELYSNAFMVVIPSERESFSIILYEALYYNGLVLCSDCDQFSQTVNGFVQFFKNSNVQSLKEGLQLLITDQKLRQQIRDNVSSIDFTIHNWDNVVEMYLNYYQKIFTKENN